MDDGAASRRSAEGTEVGVVTGGKEDLRVPLEREPGRKRVGCTNCPGELRRVELAEDQGVLGAAREALLARGANDVGADREVQLRQRTERDVHSAVEVEAVEDALR